MPADPPLAGRRPVVLVVHPMAERGGSDMCLLRMVGTLAACDVHVAVPAPHPLAAELIAAGATVHVVPMSRISSSYEAADWLRYALAWPLSVLRLVVLGRRVGAQLVSSNSLHSWYGWAAAPLLRRPHLWHAREIVVQSSLALRVERLLTRRFAAAVVAMSRAIGDQLDAPRIVVDLEYPDPAEFRPSGAGTVRAELGLSADTPLAGFVGRLDVWKGLDVLLAAWPAVREAVPDAVLVVVGGAVAGKAQYAESLRQRAAALPGVRWLGPRRDVPALMADLDVFVAPSTEPEPYGLVLVEALAAGCPVVSTAAGGPVEIVAAAADGAGTLVPPRDAVALAAAVADRLGTVDPDRGGRPPLSRPRPSLLPELVRELARG